VHFKDYVNLVEMNIQEPIDYYEASQRSSWKASMESKIESIHKNNTCELMKLLACKNPITSKWVFKVKKTSNTEVDKLKVKLVARGFHQCKGLDLMKLLPQLSNGQQFT
jgi:hypothetical protein